MISLVTACMNREQHLRQTLPRWLTLPGVSEIVIVDWSNRTPLRELCALDARIRVIRVQDEPRWILSYAYNVGVAHARGPLIFKCDADCVPTPDALAQLPDSTHFLSGYWKSGAALNKPSVNGQCFFTQEQFRAVHGYSEFIRTYGRDDEDFYERLAAAGFARREIPATTLEFIVHGNDERVVNQLGPVHAGTSDARLATIVREPVYQEMRNAHLAQRLPWHAGRPAARYTTRATDERHIVLARDKRAELPVPPEIERDAHLFSLRHLVGVLTKIPGVAAERLDERACLAAIATRLRLPRAAA